MEWIRVLLSRCAALLRGKKLDADLDDELRAHLDLAMAEHRRNGMSEAEARRRLCASSAALRNIAKPTAFSADCQASSR